MMTAAIASRDKPIRAAIHCRRRQTLRSKSVDVVEPLPLVLLCSDHGLLWGSYGDHFVFNWIFFNP
ncbi:hypothetical protein DPMN_138635 [Dreissena polymorpha]|uniref:Uncharacterized protein n=1 Tax=Dreissena polymorpha TaxID=45954 RepID=A0A9D4JFT7_DREPO|nr:hypothetical protein DPMN_138635 [Dreissena polymorpha]